MLFNNASDLKYGTNSMANLVQYTDRVNQIITESF